jgi:hypothetical protein
MPKNDLSRSGSDASLKNPRSSAGTREKTAVQRYGFPLPEFTRQASSQQENFLHPTHMDVLMLPSSSTEGINNPNRETLSEQTGSFQQKDFEQIGGRNIALKDARIIGLGSSHTNEMHSIHIAKLISSFAGDGDIVLVEGIPANQEIDQGACKETQSVPKKVRVFGWDSMELQQKGWENMKTLSELEGKVRQSQQDRDDNTFQVLMKQAEKLNNEIKDIVQRQRNGILTKAICDAQQQFPNKKIFVIAGSGHFGDNPSLKEILDAQPYIALKPTHVLPEEERQKRAREYYTGQK